MKCSAIIIFLILVLHKQDTYAQTAEAFTDSRDSKEYEIVQHGSQIWMNQNLAFQPDSGFHMYKQRKGHCKKHGYLYQFETAQDVCPVGWHLPTTDEFQTLVDHLNPDDSLNFKDLSKQFREAMAINFSGQYWYSYDKYIRGKFPFRYISFWCADSESTNSKGLTWVKKFEINHFGKRLGGMSESGLKNAYPVRCIKN